MTTCPHCAADLTAKDLVRHVRETRTVVHCPNCKRLLGEYRDPSAPGWRGG